jgi:hypothetical protein
MVWIEIYPCIIPCSLINLCRRPFIRIPTRHYLLVLLLTPYLPLKLLHCHIRMILLTQCPMLDLKLFLFQSIRLHD